MSLYNKKKSQKLSASIRVNIPIDVQNQIKHLCKEINTIEWSGVLFYTIEGSIQDPTNCGITLQQILPLDKGSAGYTEYTLGPEVVKFMRANEAMEKDWKLGHIHSHHNMSVFFSGTDQSEIEDNSENHNFYLSVIVNNKGDIVGKVGITATSQLPEEVEGIGFVAINEEGDEYIIESITKVEEKKYFEYECKFFQENSVIVSDEFKTLITQMKHHSGREFPSANSHNYSRSSGSQKIWGAQTVEEDDEVDESKIGFKKNKYSITPVKEPILSESLSEFHFQLLANEDPGALAMSSLEDILDYYTAVDVSPEDFKDEVLKKYDKLFDEIFTEERTPPRFYVLRKTFETLKELSPGNKTKQGILQPLIKGLEDKYDDMEVVGFRG